MTWNPVKRLSHCTCDKLTPGVGHQPGWFERLLILLVPHFDIVKSPDKGTGSDGTKVSGQFTTVYLRRFYLFRSKWFGLNWGDLYLHHIVRSDDDPDPHDHPWGFMGWIIAGGYTDQQWYWWKPQVWLESTISIPGRKLVGQKLHQLKGKRLGPDLEEVKAGSFIKRKATHIHRVIVPEGKTAWTLILTEPYGRDWNFITENGPVMWRKYLGIPDEIDVGE